jgi:hypothetical protein
MLGARRSPAVLPASKEEIVLAIRMLTAKLYYQGLDDEDGMKPLFRAAMFLDSFTHDAPDSIKMLESMEARRQQLCDFQQELVNVPRNDPYFWQRVYALAGISTVTKGSTFFETLKARLGRAVGRDQELDTVAA